MIIPLRSPHYGSSWVEAHSVYFSLSLSLEREQGGSIMRRKYFFRARIHARSESRDWNTREISSLRLLRPRLCSSLCTRLSPSLSSCTVFFFSLRNNGTIDIDIASRMCLRMKWNGKRRSQQRMRNETRELGAFRNACTRKKSNFILSLVPWNRSSSNFVRIVGKYKGKRNGRGMAIELTRPSLAHTYTETFSRVFRDILITLPWKRKREIKREGAKLLAHDELPLKVLPLTSASCLFPAIPHVCQRASLMKCSNAMPSNNSAVSRPSL